MALSKKLIVKSNLTTTWQIELIKHQADYRDTYWQKTENYASSYQAVYLDLDSDIKLLDAIKSSDYANVFFLII